MDAWVYSVLAVILAVALSFNLLFPNFWRDVHQLRAFYAMQAIKASKKTFLDLFKEIVQQHGTKAALIHAITGEETTYRQLDERSNQVANWAISVGLREGQVVAVLAPNTPDYVMWWLGLIKAGLCASLINFNLRARSLSHCVKVCNASAFFVVADPEGSLISAAEEVWPSLKEEDSAMRFFSFGRQANGATRIDDDLRSATADRLQEERSFLQKPKPVIYLYTSGTTGLPKAAVVSASKLKVMASIFRLFYLVTAKDRVYNCMPLYHSAGGLLGVGTMLTTGSTMVIRPKFSARNFFPDIKKYNCTVFQYVGELCRYLAAMPPSDMDRKHGAKRGIGNGLRPDVWDKFADRFGVLCQEYYGSTEGNVAFFNHIGKRHSVGIWPWVARRENAIAFLKYDPVEGKAIRDEKTGLYALAGPGEPGVMVGIIDDDLPFDGYSRQADTDKKIVYNVLEHGDKFMDTGDIMSMDKDGYVFFHDRAGDTFRWKSENVSTTEVAEIITTYEGVAECTVYGVKIPGCDGRAGMAALVLDSGANIKWHDFFQFIAKDLPSYAHPVFLRIQEELELTGTFKYNKVQLMKNGFSPGDITDKLLYREASKSTYADLTKDIYDQIIDGKLRL